MELTREDRVDASKQHGECKEKGKIGDRVGYCLIICEEITDFVAEKKADDPEEDPYRR